MVPTSRPGPAHWISSRFTARYIATLLQGSIDSQTQVVRHEAYQWLVLTAWCLWFIGLVLATPWNLRGSTATHGGPAVPAARAAACGGRPGLTIASASVLCAQDPPAAGGRPPRTQDSCAYGTGASGSASGADG